MIRIMFVCHGNICRSPMAEFIMKKLVRDTGLHDEFHIESSATSTEEIWNGKGNPVYPPAKAELKKHGISCEGKCAVQLKKGDYETPRVIADPDNYNARANIMWAGTVAHNDIVGVGRSQDWNSHAIEHELSGMYDVAHGAGLAVIMPAWMEFVMNHNVMRFAQMAVRVFGCEMNFEKPELTAKKGIDSFRKFLHSIGLPVNFDELGAKEEDIPALVNNLGLGDGRTGGFVKLSSADVTEIYKIAAKAEICEG